MKRYGRSITFAFCLAVMAIPGVSFAAGSGHFVIVDQGYQDQTFTLPSGKLIEATVLIGTGWTGTTTGAFVSGSYHSAGVQGSVLSIQAFTDSTYTTTVGSGCEYDDSPYSGTDINGLVQLNQYITGASCNFHALYFYRVSIAISNYTGANWDIIRGTNSPLKPWVWAFSTSTANDVVPTFSAPYFSIVGNGFQIKVPQGYDCSLIDPVSYTGCIMNALTIMFYPSASAFDNFTSIGESINTKVPFGYLSQTFLAVQGFNDATTSAFTLSSDSTINDNIFTPLRTALAVLLWAVFALWFFTYLRGLQIV